MTAMHGRNAIVAVGSPAIRFGFGPGQALITKNVYTDRHGYTVRFDRTYRGLPSSVGTSWYT